MTGLQTCSVPKTLYSPFSPFIFERERGQPRCGSPGAPCRIPLTAPAILSPLLTAASKREAGYFLRFLASFFFLVF